MSKLIVLSNGDAIRADAIISVTKHNSCPSVAGMPELPPRVCVSFEVGGVQKFSTVMCSDYDARDQTAIAIIDQIAAST